MFPFVALLGFSIPSYGLMLLMGLVFGSLLAFRLNKKNQQPWEDLVIIAACAVGVGVLVTKILYALVTFSLSEIIMLIRTGNFQLVIEGAVFYGGVIGGAIGAALGSRIAGTSFWSYEASIIPALPLGHAFGRIGCFLAGCCYGIPVPRPFGIAFSKPVSDAPIGVPLLPIQLIEALFNFVICGILLYFLRKNRKPGAPVLLYLSLYTVLRFILEFFRGDSLRGHFYGLSTSQWISAAILVGALIATAQLRRKRNTPSHKI